MITQSATVYVKASTAAEWDALKSKLPGVSLPEGSTVTYNDLIRTATITVPEQEIKL